jgi:hypothetical protein
MLLNQQEMEDATMLDTDFQGKTELILPSGVKKTNL